MSTLDTVLQKHLAGASLTEALAGVADDNPQLAAITQALALREQRAASEAEEDQLEDAEAVAVEQDDNRYEALQAQFESISVDVARLQDTIEEVAAALGACPVCLGADATCLLCHGRGLPGSLPPDPTTFDQVVLPAVRAWAFARSKRVRRGPPTDQPIPEPTERSAQ